MIRFIFLIAVCAGIYFLWLHIQTLRKQQSTQTHQEDVEPMVKCNFCQAYTPQKSSVKGSDGQWYCSLAHEQQVGK